MLLLVMGAGNDVWAEEEIAYTFQTEKNTSNTAYATNYDVTIKSVSWNVPGNQNFTGYVRIGGKSLDKVNRVIKSNGTLSDDITKIVFNHNGKSNANLTIHSIKLEVASNSSFSTIVDTRTFTNPSISVSTAGSLEFTPSSSLSSWGTNKYYRFTINVSNSKTSKYGLDVTSIVFYKGTPSSTPTIPRTISITTTDMDLTVGGATQTRTGTLSAGTGTITYSSSDGDVATVNATTGEVTPVGEGSCTITASVPAEGNYAEASASYTVNVTDPSNLHFTWDLTTNSYSSPTTSSVVWTSSSATMTLAKGSGTNANNYLGGVSGHTETRFYNNNNLSIAPASGYQIIKVEITTSTPGYINGTWTNGTVTQTTSPVKIVPTDGTAAISTTPTNTTKVTGVTVYYKAVGSGPQASDLAVTSPLAVTVGGTADISYTTSSTGAMTFTSNNTSVATVNASGKVTGVAVGTTTISVSQAADATYAASDVKTVTVNVSAAPSGTTYTKVTNASGLEDGSEYILVYESGASARVMGAVTTIGASISGFTISDNSIVVTDQAVNVLTLSANGSQDGKTKYRFLTSIEGKTLCWNSGNSLNVDNASVANKFDWFLEYSGSTLTIKNVSDDARKLQYNSGSPRFACYTSSQSPVALYVKEESGTVPTFTPSSIANQNLVVGATYETAAISVNSGGTLSATSSDEDVATVAWNGTTNKATVTAVSAGETTIKIKAAKYDEYKSGELSFTVTVVAPTIELNKTSAGLEIGGTETLTATLTNADGATVDWTTSDDAIVSISGTGASRTITAMAAGTATITASINVNGYDYEATCEVTVQAHLEEGDYVIEHDGRYMKNEIVSDRLGSDDNCNFTTSGKAINPDPSIVWHIAKSGDYYTIYNAAEEKYAASTGADNRAQLLASGTDDKAKWSVDGGTGETWDFVNKYNESNGKNSHLRYNPGYGFACYAESFSERLILHPVVTGPWIMLNKNSTGLDLGWTEVLTATTNHPEATVTWTSSDPAKVSVSADGAKCTITGVAAGEATITASITVSGTVYSETCHVKVGPVKVYQKVTSASGLEAGKNYILVYESGTSARLMGSVNKHGGSTYYGESLRGYTITDNKIAVYDESVNVLTLSEGTPSGYAFETSIENQYLSWTSGNSLSTSATKAGSSSWELTFAASGDLTITNVATSSRELHYNLGSPRFACYDKSGQKAVALYVEVPHYAFRVYSGSSMDYENVLVTDAAPALTDNQVAVLIKTLTSAELEAVPVPIKTADRVVINGEAASIVVTDKQAGVSTNNGYTNFYAPAAFTTTSKVSYTRSGVSGFNSVCLPFSYTVAQACSASMFGTDAEIYVLGSVTDGAVNFVKMTEGTVAAGTPVIVKTSTTTSWNINGLSGTFAVNGAAPVEDPKSDGSRKATLKGAYQTLTINTGDASENGHSYYKLNSTGTYFVKVPANAKVYPFRVYLDVETLGAAPAPAQLSFRLIDGGDFVMDPSVSIADVTTLVNMLLGKGNVTTTDDGIHYVRPTDGQQMSADWDGDGQVSISDVTKLVNKVLKK